MISLGFTRPPEYLDESIRLAGSMGFSVTAAPSLTRIPAPEAEFYKIFERIEHGEFSVIMFSSSAAVNICRKMLDRRFTSACRNTEIAVIGPETKRALENAGLSADIMPEIYSSDGLLNTLGTSVRGRKILLIRSDAGSDILDRGLRGLGAEPETFRAYHLEPCRMCEKTKILISAFCTGELDAMAFSSPLSAKTFYGHMCNVAGEETASKCIRNRFVAVIGHPTADAVRSLGKEPDLISCNATFPDMLRDIKLSLSAGMKDAR